MAEIMTKNNFVITVLMGSILFALVAWLVDSTADMTRAKRAEIVCTESRQVINPTLERECAQLSGLEY